MTRAEDDIPSFCHAHARVPDGIRGPRIRGGETKRETPISFKQSSGTPTEIENITAGLETRIHPMAIGGWKGLPSRAIGGIRHDEVKAPPRLEEGRIPEIAVDQLDPFRQPVERARRPEQGKVDRLPLDHGHTSVRGEPPKRQEAERSRTGA